MSISEKGQGPNLDGPVVINDSGADADFRVETNGQANAVFVLGDATTFGTNTAGRSGFVGVGTNEPTSSIHIHETTSAANVLPGFRITGPGDTDPTANYGMTGFALMKHTDASGGAGKAQHAVMVNLEDAPFTLGANGLGGFVGGTTQGMLIITGDGKVGIGYKAGGNGFVPGGNATTNLPQGRLDIGDGALFMSSMSAPTVPANREIAGSSTATTTGALYVEDNSGEPVLKFKSNSATYTVTIVAD